MRVDRGTIACGRRERGGTMTGRRPPVASRAGRVRPVPIRPSPGRAGGPGSQAYLRQRRTRPHPNGEPRAIALFILMLASLALAFLAR